LKSENLSVAFQTSSGSFTAVDRFSLNVNPGDVVSIVGESGSGKSVAMLALMGLLPWTAKVTADVLQLRRRDLLNIHAKAPAGHRQGDRHDLPGAHDQPQPLLHGRVSAHRSPEESTVNGPQGPP
jgi:ABC-type dipeptide/oligopeptide/nickel transport system ATPase component